MREWALPVLVAILLGMGVVWQLLRRKRKRVPDELVAGRPHDPMLLEKVGDWRLVEELGNKENAKVFRGLPAGSLEVVEQVAIKVLPGELSEQDVESSKKLVHPNIARLLEHGTQAGQVYVVQEYVDGGTLREKLQLPVTPERLLEVMGPVFEAVAYAHKQGLVHRSLKPANVMLTRSEKVIVTDFGVPQREDKIYSAPEGLHEQSGDQYALGVICYELLSGSPPPEPPPPLGTCLDGPILRMLCRDPVGRFPHVQLALKALREALPAGEKPAP